VTDPPAGIDGVVAMNRSRGADGWCLACPSAGVVSDWTWCSRHGIAEVDVRRRLRTRFAPMIVYGGWSTCHTGGAPELVSDRFDNGHAIGSPMTITEYEPHDWRSAAG